MRCPYCGDGQAPSVRDWEADGAVRRLRECPSCGRQFLTSEQPENVFPTVVKRSGHREPYRRRKLARSIALACAKRPLSTSALRDLVGRVEAQLASSGETEIAAAQIGELTLTELRSLDEVAYLRFASFQRAFTSASAFVDEVEAFQEWRRRSAGDDLQMTFDFDADQPHWN